MQDQVRVTGEEVRLLLDNNPVGNDGCFKVLLVHSDEKMLCRIAGILPDNSLSLHFCRDPIKALDLCRSENFDLVITDFAMPGLDGVEMLTFIQSLLPNARRVLLSGVTDKSILIRAINNARVDAFIEESMDDTAFRSVMNSVLPPRE